MKSKKKSKKKRVVLTIDTELSNASLRMKGAIKVVLPNGKTVDARSVQVQMLDYDG